MDSNDGSEVDAPPGFRAVSVSAPVSPVPLEREELNGAGVGSDSEEPTQSSNSADDNSPSTEAMDNVNILGMPLPLAKNASHSHLHVDQVLELSPQAPKRTEVLFRVECKTIPGEEVYVTGNCPELGNWKADGGQKLSTDSTMYPWWEGTVDIRSGIQLEYKYYVVYEGERKGKRDLRRWEGCENHKLTVFGFECHVDDGTFGTGSDHDAVWADEGWLSTDCQATLRLGTWEEGKKCLQMHIPTEDGFWMNFSPVETDENVTVRYMDQQDLVFVNGSSPQALGVNIDVYRNGTDHRVGRAILSGESIQEAFEKPRSRTSESVCLCIISEDLSLVGYFYATCLVCSPFTHSENHMGNVFRRHWSQKQAVDIGHRGMGNSRTHNDQTKRAIVTENTVLSFQLAAQSGADFVEFDVQLTKDRVPVIYHDFSLEINLGKTQSGDRRKSKSRMLDVGVHQVTLAEMKDLHHNMQPEFDSALTKRFMRVLETKKKMGRTFSSNDFHDLKFSRSTKNGLSDSNNDGKLRPHWAIKAEVATLKEVFEQVPEWLGFNIEVKYPMVDEMEPNMMYYERNEYLDTILHVVFDYGKKRRILFSSFDADICYMLALKQPRYPVFLLTEGGMVKYTDVRACSLESAMDWAVTAHLRGIVSDSRPIVNNDGEMVRQIKAKNLLLFTYGFQNENPELRALQKAYGVDGLITDHVRKLTRKEHKHESEFERKHRMSSVSSEKPPSDQDIVIEPIPDAAAMVGNQSLLR